MPITPFIGVRISWLMLAKLALGPVGGVGFHFGRAQSGLGTLLVGNIAHDRSQTDQFAGFRAAHHESRGQRIYRRSGLEI